jgi:hypothetical protein
MGLLLDIVPNHMGVSEHNKLWMDVLEHGRSSAYAPFFDIEWNSSFCPVSFTLYFCCNSFAKGQGARSMSRQFNRSSSTIRRTQTVIQ